MRSRIVPFAIVFLLIAVAVGISALTASFRGKLADGTRGAFSAPFAFVGDLFGSSSELEQLADENARLKAELLFLMNEPELKPLPNRPELIARVHSTYPTNNRGLLVLNAGASHGVKPGMAVTVDGFTFLGVIEEVQESSSVVRTVFDTDWKLPVRVGPDAVDALLIGGRNPRLSLIVKSGNVTDGNNIVTASKEIPYGLKVGEVQGVTGNVGSAFQEGGILLPYESNISEVVILL